MRVLAFRFGARHRAPGASPSAATGGVCAWLLACALALAPIARGAEPEPAGEAPEESQILVMIRMAPAHFRPDVDYGDGYAGRSGHAARRRVAEEIAREHRLRLLTHWPMPAIGVECFVMQAPEGVPAAVAAEAVARDPRPAWAQPLQTFRAQGYNDPLYDQQPTAHFWKLHALHAVATGRGVVIAQIDSGADVQHPDLRGQFQLAQNTVAGSGYVAERHGTAVAGILVAHANNRIGAVGVAPGARVLALRACRERTPGAATCDSLSLAKGLHVALDRGARVINLSVTGPDDRLLRELLTAAIARGAIVVAPVDAASGGFPASLRGVIAVVESDPAAAGTAGQSRDATAPPATAPSGALPPLSAPGRDVPTTLPGGRWGLVSGASFATAEVSGMVALLLELLPHAGGAEVDALLRGGTQRTSREPTGAPTPINACRTVSAAAGRCVCDCAGEASNSALVPR